MSYKIAVASSDGKQIDETFGSASGFMIYEVSDGGYQKLEKRVFTRKESAEGSKTDPSGCRTTDGCAGDGCHNSAGGCGGQDGASAKVELVADCRCVVCQKIGFPIQKQLERRAISAFDVSCSVEEALDKISFYFGRIDNHESLRGKR